MNRPLLLCLSALGLVLALGGTSRANLITNGSFEAGAYSGGSFETLSANSTAISGWTVSQGTIDWIGSYWTSEDGNHSLDLNGDTTGGIQASTSFSVTKGQSYLLTFYMSGNPDGDPVVKSMTVSAGTDASGTYTYDTTGNDDKHMNWVQKSLAFTAHSTGAETLTFTSNVNVNDNRFGPALDNVSLTAVPEPATVALCGTSLLGIAGLAWRRGRKAKLAQG